MKVDFTLSVNFTGLGTKPTVLRFPLQTGGAGPAQLTSYSGVPVAGAPYTGVFAPANPQSAFAGENADGTWTLNVSDGALFDTGSVRAFSLETTGFSCTP